MIPLLAPGFWQAFFACFLTGLNAWAQQDYPQDYFRNPLAIPISLAGNFGECRPGHFHSGIDIKTNGVEGLPVYAAADGYISRIKTSPTGFGHVLYITHPNGFTTVYAHLSRFNDALQAFLRKEQYRKESWTVDLTPSSDQFPVKKGQQIAWSGNTGSSMAPHLHFEIRNTATEHPLNPQLFGLPIIDRTPPKPLQVAIYNGSLSLYEQTPAYYSLVKSGPRSYTTSARIVAPSQALMLGIVADDFMDGSTNTLNFYTAEWWLDTTFIGRIRLDDIGYDVTRYLHAYVDYSAYQRKKIWVQLLGRLPGNELLHLYEGLIDGKALALPDTLEHRLRIRLTDAAGNSSEILAPLKGSVSNATTVCNPERAAGEPVAVNTHPNIRFQIPDSSFYDRYCFQFSEVKEPNAVSPRFTLGSPMVPVHDYFTLRIRPDRTLSFSFQNKLALRYSDGRSQNGQAARYEENGWYSARVRQLGDYWLAVDTVAPVIKLVIGKTALREGSRVVLEIDDALSGVSKANAYLDGHWVLLQQQGKRWFYELDEHCPKGKSKMKVVAVDEVGNERTFSLTLERM